MSIKREDLELHALITENYSDFMNSYKFSNLSESEKISISKGLIDQIYMIMADRYKSINFELIPKSAGKIRNMAEYNNLVSSLELLSNIAKDSKQSIPEIDIIKEALSYIERYENTFYMGFVRKNAPIIMIYNLLTMCVYCATSLMISVLVDYININMSSEELRPSESVDMIINKKYRRSHQYLMIDVLKKFNEQVRDGTFEKVIQVYVRQNSKTVMNESALSTMAIIGGIIFILKFIPIMKFLIYLFFYTRIQLSEAFAIQANLINGNLEALKNKGYSKDSKVYKIQKWFADKLTVLSNKFAVKYEKGEKQAEMEAKAKLTPDDIMLF